MSDENNQPTRPSIEDRHGATAPVENSVRRRPQGAEQQHEPDRIVDEATAASEPVVSTPRDDAARSERPTEATSVSEPARDTPVTGPEPSRDSERTEAATPDRDDDEAREPVAHDEAREASADETRETSADERRRARGERLIADGEKQDRGSRIIDKATDAGVSDDTRDAGAGRGAAVAAGAGGLAAGGAAAAAHGSDRHDETHAGADRVDADRDDADRADVDRADADRDAAASRASDADRVDADRDVATSRASDADRAEADRDRATSRASDADRAHADRERHSHRASDADRVEEPTDSDVDDKTQVQPASDGLYRDEAPTEKRHDGPGAGTVAAGAGAVGVAGLVGASASDDNDGAESTTTGRDREAERQERQRALGVRNRTPDIQPAPQPVATKPTTDKAIASIGLLVLRWIVAGIMGIRGYQHLTNLGATQDYFRQSLLPAPDIFAIGFGVAECLIALLLVLGLWTRFAGLLILVLEVGTLVFFIWGKVPPFSADRIGFNGEFELLLAGVGFLLLLIGSGGWAVDAGLRGRRRRRKALKATGDPVRTDR